MNLAICAVLLRQYVAPFKASLETDYLTPGDKLNAVRNAASDNGDSEIESILDYIESRGLTKTFFPE